MIATIEAGSPAWRDWCSGKNQFQQRCGLSPGSCCGYTTTKPGRAPAAVLFLSAAERGCVHLRCGGEARSVLRTAMKHADERERAARGYTGRGVDQGAPGASR